MKIWSRRKFLGTGVLGSLAITGAAATEFPSSDARTTGPVQHVVPAFPARERQLLRTVMDELIPATDGNLAASEVGCMDYLERLSARDAKVGKNLRTSLAAVESLSKSHHQASFVALSTAKRVSVLTTLSNQQADNFEILRDSVYEAYYEQPRVWNRIGYTCYQTNSGGPTPKPFDEKVLAEVRKKPKYYREA